MVARVIEPEDLVGGEIGQLSKLAAVYRLAPEIGDTGARHDVEERAAIGRPCVSHPALRKIEGDGRRSSVKGDNAGVIPLGSCMFIYEHSGD